MVQGLLKYHLGGLQCCFCLCIDFIEAGGVVSLNWHSTTKVNAKLLIFVLRSLPLDNTNSVHVLY